MSHNKCSYIIFCNSNNNTSALNLKLSNGFIPKDNNPRFLGITFDRTICFIKNSEIIKEKSIERLNIIKIVSHKSWKLSSKTLSNLYKTLLRSILDYSFFTISQISISTLNFLQAIQNQAIRLIYKLAPDTSTLILNDFAAKSNLTSVSERYNDLFTRYAEKALEYNSLIIELMDEYISSINSIIRDDSYSTPLTYANSLIARNLNAAHNETLTNDNFQDTL